MIDANLVSRYEKVEEILRDFYALRIKYYGKRKDYLIGQLKAEADKLSNQARFILEKCDKDLVVENKKRKVMVDELIKRGGFFHPSHLNVNILSDRYSRNKITLKIKYFMLFFQGYDADPIAAWKKKVAKEAGRAGDAEEPESDEEDKEEEDVKPSKGGKPIDSGNH